MRVKVIGARYATGTSKKTQKPYNGFFVSIGYEQQGYNGLKAEERFVSVEALQGVVPAPGMILNIETDFTGFVRGVTVETPRNDNK